MTIASTVFVPHGNDTERGGAADKFSLERVGRMMKAKKDGHG